MRCKAHAWKAVIIPSDVLFSLKNCRRPSASRRHMFIIINVLFITLKYNLLKKKGGCIFQEHVRCEILEFWVPNLTFFVTVSWMFDGTESEIRNTWRQIKCQCNDAAARRRWRLQHVHKLVNDWNHTIQSHISIHSPATSTPADTIININMLSSLITVLLCMMLIATTEGFQRPSTYNNRKLHGSQLSMVSGNKANFGIFSPAVVAAKFVLGEAKLNKVWGEFDYSQIWLWDQVKVGLNEHIPEKMSPRSLYCAMQWDFSQGLYSNVSIKWNQKRLTQLYSLTVWILRYDCIYSSQLRGKAISLHSQAITEWCLQYGAYNLRLKLVRR